MSLNHYQALRVNTYNSYELLTFKLASFRAQNQLIHHSKQLNMVLQFGLEYSGNRTTIQLMWGGFYYEKVMLYSKEKAQD